MKTIKATFIDTAGHGYLSVSKKDIQAIGLDHNVLTRYSGHTLTRMYLEEDCDASYFMNFCEKAGITVKIKDSYNEKFKITHNYNPELFSYSPAVGDRINEEYVITEVRPKRIIIRHTATGMKYSITTSNPFQYIEQVLPASSVNQNIS